MADYTPQINRIYWSGEAIRSESVALKGMLYLELVTPAGSLMVNLSEQGEVFIASKDGPGLAVYPWVANKIQVKIEP